jgi:hypothetical protein
MKPYPVFWHLLRRPASCRVHCSFVLRTIPEKDGARVVIPAENGNPNRRLAQRFLRAYASLVVLVFLALTVIGCEKKQANMQVLLDAAQSGDTALFKSEMAKGFDGNRLNVLDGKLSVTPLHAAAMKGNTEMIRMLLDAGVKVDLKLDDSDPRRAGATPLGFAVTMSQSQAVDLLLRRGADPNAKWGRPSAYGTQRNDYDTWEMAIMNGQLDIIASLMKYNSKLTDKEMNDAIILAINNKDKDKGVEIVKTLLANGHKSDSPTVQAAVASRRKDIAVLLLESMDAGSAAITRKYFCPDCKCKKCDAYKGKYLLDQLP